MVKRDNRTNAKTAGWKEGRDDLGHVCFSRRLQPSGAFNSTTVDRRCMREVRDPVELVPSHDHLHAPQARTKSRSPRLGPLARTNHTCVTAVPLLPPTYGTRGVTAVARAAVAAGVGGTPSGNAIAVGARVRGRNNRKPNRGGSSPSGRALPRNGPAAVVAAVAEPALLPP